MANSKALTNQLKRISERYAQLEGHHNESLYFERNGSLPGSGFAEMPSESIGLTHPTFDALSNTTSQKSEDMLTPWVAFIFGDHTTQVPLKKRCQKETYLSHSIDKQPFQKKALFLISPNGCMAYSDLTINQTSLEPFVKFYEDFDLKWNKRVIKAYEDKNSHRSDQNGQRVLMTSTEVQEILYLFDCTSCSSTHSEKALDECEREMLSILKNLYQSTQVPTESFSILFQELKELDIESIPPLRRDIEGEIEAQRVISSIMEEDEIEKPSNKEILH